MNTCHCVSFSFIHLWQIEGERKKSQLEETVFIWWDQNHHRGVIPSSRKLSISDWSWKGLLTNSMQGKMTVLTTASGMETLVLWCDVTWPKVPHWLKIFSLAMQSLLLFYMRVLQMNNLFWCTLLSFSCKCTKTLGIQDKRKWWN